MKNNKIVHEAMIKQVDMMFPAEMKDPVKAAMEKCKGVGKWQHYLGTYMKIFRLCQQQIDSQASLALLGPSSYNENRAPYNNGRNIFVQVNLTSMPSPKRP